MKCFGRTGTLALQLFYGLAASGSETEYRLIRAPKLRVIVFVQMYFFAIAGEKLTKRLRGNMFRAMLSQEMAWFDRKDNGVGALCAKLSGEAASVQGVSNCSFLW
jgi:ABC-type multidrug transport system fused ATPase/permease subunit